MVNLALHGCIAQAGQAAAGAGPTAAAGERTSPSAAESAGDAMPCRAQFQCRNGARLQGCRMTIPCTDPGQFAPATWAVWTESAEK